MINPCCLFRDDYQMGVQLLCPPNLHLCVGVHKVDEGLGGQSQLSRSQGHQTWISDHEEVPYGTALGEQQLGAPRYRRIYHDSNSVVHPTDVLG